MLITFSLNAQKHNDSFASSFNSFLQSSSQQLSGSFSGFLNKLSVDNSDRAFSFQSDDSPLIKTNIKGL